jgi:hypothetical protein
LSKEEDIPEVWVLRNKRAKAITTSGTKDEMIALRKEYNTRYQTDDYEVAPYNKF